MSYMDELDKHIEKVRLIHCFGYACSFAAAS